MGTRNVSSIVVERACWLISSAFLNFSLPSCGHTFCQTCVKMWFNTILTQHKLLYPSYSLTVPLPLAIYARRNTLLGQLDIRNYSDEYRNQNPHPGYTCPTCRTMQRSQPVEVFKLKEIVTKVAAVSFGKTSPPREEQNANNDIGKVWDRFFFPS